MTKFTIEDLIDIAYRGSYDDLERELALQLLASMEQTPVYLRPFGDDGETFVACDGDDERTITLYAAPQLPQPVPDDVMTAIQKVARIRLDLNGFDGDRRGIADCLGEAEEALIEVVNRRAATLQGAEPVSQPYTLRDGWVAVPVEMAPEQMRAVQLNSELGAYAAANLSGAYLLFREFWDVAVKSARNQEAK